MPVAVSYRYSEQPVADAPRPLQPGAERQKVKLLQKVKPQKQKRNFAGAFVQPEGTGTEAAG